MSISRLRNDGQVIFHEGFMPEAEARRLDRQAQSGESKPDTKPRPEMSGPMAEYMNLHRHSIARAALIKHPKMAMRLDRCPHDNGFTALESC